MLPLVLSALLSLAAAQCGNSCNCGVTTCCQTSYSSGSPYSIFNIGNNQQYSYEQTYGSGQQHGSGQQYGSSARPDAAKTACLKTNPIPVSLTQLHTNQPVFTRIIPDNDINKLKDNICLTFFPHPDDSSTYVQYDSTVYRDGSNSVKTYISSGVGTGSYLKGHAYASTFVRFCASLGHNILVGCSQDAYGDSDLPSVYALSVGSISPLGGGCIQEIQNIIQCVGQGPADGLYVLPYRLPTRCVTQQVCTLFNPLLYSNNNMYGSSNNQCGNERC